MKKTKKLMAISLAAMTALSAMNVPVFADENIDINSAKEQIEPINVTPSTKVTLNTGESSQLIPWPVYSGYGHWKIYLENRSSSPTTVRIFKGTPTGPQVGAPMVIPAGQRLPFYSDASSPLEEGVYYLQVTTNGAYHLNGTLYYKFATNHNELY
ncbi:MAG: hypothetical protein HFE90_10355 [Firmicutes bacterium]|nr:hypothetical protein [Bacillota bacterium]